MRARVSIMMIIIVKMTIMMIVSSVTMIMLVKITAMMVIDSAIMIKMMIMVQMMVMNTAVPMPVMISFIFMFRMKNLLGKGEKRLQNCTISILS